MENNNELEQMRQEIISLREKLDHQIIINEEHVRRTMQDKVKNIKLQTAILAAIGIAGTVFCHWAISSYIGLSLALSVTTDIFLIAAVVLSVWSTRKLHPRDMMNENLVKAGKEIAKMKEKNIAVEILRKLMAEQIAIYKRTNIVQATTFSEKINLLMNSYYNGLITNEEVIKELLKAAEEIAELRKQGEKLGLSEEEMAFYDALTKPENIKDFYENEVLVSMTRELTEMLRKNRTIDWQKKETARAGMRKMVKRLLKKYKYPPEKYDDAIETVMQQCELWTDNAEM